jgi:hypothetical protein
MKATLAIGCALFLGMPYGSVAWTQTTAVPAGQVIPIGSPPDSPTFVPMTAQVLGALPPDPKTVRVLGYAVPPGAPTLSFDTVRILGVSPPPDMNWLPSARILSPSGPPQP